MPYLMPIDCYKTKFYLKEKSSKSFLELSEERLSELSKMVYKKQEMFVNAQSYGKERFPNLESYHRTLQYLTNPYIHFDLKTFDERMAYLIMMTDPNLVTFKEFLKLDIISLENISKAENEKERDYLKKQRSLALSTYESTVREKIGFYDSKLLKYEEIFFNRFFSKKELITDVRINNQNQLMFKSKALKNFSSISDERYAELVNIAQIWLSLVPEKHNSKIATYSVTNQKNLLGLTNLTEQLVLFVLLVDSNLDMLKIYEEESMIKNAEKRITEQFGYFNKDLLVLEKKFHDRFCPEKELSVWTKIKKG